ncbi:transmembrane channel-like protein 5 [Platysternon megacephalum]|uniref:Transmembrane channel-like protein 5 n=1 Tax=Platysternon megacephalum TaxID=55544 RepID=A0A4D9E8C7_9SAUR|nr:transmembrane channel-like protein 5 [Platysternon megacephalum]
MGCTEARNWSRKCQGEGSGLNPVPQRALGTSVCSRGSAVSPLPVPKSGQPLLTKNHWAVGYAGEPLSVSPGEAGSRCRLDFKDRRPPTGPEGTLETFKHRLQVPTHGAHVPATSRVMPAERVRDALELLEKAVRPRMMPAKQERMESSMNARVASQKAAGRGQRERERSTQWDPEIGKGSWEPDLV